MRQAAFDLRAAKNSLRDSDFEWACFKCQQSAEKALKAFLFLKGKRELLTHPIYSLLKNCIAFDKRFQKIIDCKALHQYYIPTCYPSSLPGGIPHEFYKKEDALKCVNYAGRVLALARELIKR